MTFKPGDKLLCVKALGSFPPLEEGKVYTVHRFGQSSPGNVWVVYGGHARGFFPYRFKALHTHAEVGTFPFLNPGKGRV